MKRADLLASRSREVLLDGTWIANTNWQKQLSNINIEQANKSVKNLNTIATLTFHINYYISGLNDFFETGELTIKDEFSFDVQELKNDFQWTELKEDLINNSQQFIKHLSNFTDDQLDQVFVKNEYGTYLRNIDAMIEHAYYHLGQVSLIKKMIEV